MADRRILVERVAVKSLRRIASCPAAGWRPASPVSLRTILTDIRLCTEEQGSEGKLLSLWREESPDYRGRRYSGPGDKTPPELKRVKSRGANPRVHKPQLVRLPGIHPQSSQEGASRPLCPRHRQLPCTVAAPQASESAALGLLR